MTKGNRGYKSPLSVRNKEEMLQNENYRKFLEDKQQVKSKYNPRIFLDSGAPNTLKEKKWFSEEGRIEYRKYLNEMINVMLDMGSNYSKFIEDVEPESDKVKRERATRGRINKTKGHSYT